jgi:hypothetical protein
MEDETPETWGIFEADLDEVASQALDLVTTISLANNFDPLKWLDSSQGVIWVLRLGAALQGPLGDTLTELAGVRPAPYSCRRYPYQRTGAGCLWSLGGSVYRRITGRFGLDDLAGPWATAVAATAVAATAEGVIDLGGIEPLIPVLKPGPQFQILRMRRWLCALLREAAWEIERAGYERAKLGISTSGKGASAQDRTATGATQRNRQRLDSRNQFIYEQMCAGVKQRAIFRKVNETPGWDPLENIRSVGTPATSMRISRESPSRKKS